MLNIVVNTEKTTESIIRYKYPIIDSHSFKHVKNYIFEFHETINTERILHLKTKPLNKLNTMKQLLIISTCLLLISCVEKTKEKIEVEVEVKEEVILVSNDFIAVPMPDKLITGNSFPTDSTTINNWVNKSTAVNNLETNKDIINHGWGIWQALTKTTDQTNNGQPLRRFETWYTPDDIIEAYKMREKKSATELKHIKRTRGNMKRFNQLHGANTTTKNPEDGSVVGFVKYDPSAAKHIYENNLFYESTLEGLLKKDQIVNIPDFPDSGVTLKPVFAPLDSINPKTGLYIIPVWPGDEGNPNRPFDSGDWNNYVSVTLDGKTNAAEHIYSIDEFIHFKLDSTQATVTGGKAGDIAILQAMHVTTREIKRWTWQTFWWSEYHNTPQSPSSKTIADLRPTNELDASANHYAMAIAYNMVQPAQPYNGGSGAKATSLYAYNPYLEAGFGKDVFAAANDTIRKYYDADYQNVGDTMNEYGMQTNCMSCHGQARYIPNLYGSKGHLYITDQYFELDAPYFKNTVKLDFTWSIQGNLINNQEEPLKN